MARLSKNNGTRVVQGEKLDSCACHPSIARNYTRGGPPLTFPSFVDENTHTRVCFTFDGTRGGGVLARGSKRGRSGERALRNLIATLVGQLIIYNRAYMHFSTATFSRKFARNFGILRMENRNLSLIDRPRKEKTNESAECLFRARRQQLDNTRALISRRPIALSPQYRPSNRVQRTGVPVQ